jgi:hypothetical protein
MKIVYKGLTGEKHPLNMYEQVAVQTAPYAP